MDKVVILSVIGVAIVCASNVIAYNWGKAFGFALGRTTSIKELITDFLPSNSEEKLKVTIERQKNSKQ
jgi:hypothetical protein